MISIRPWAFGSVLGIPNDWCLICSLSHSGIPPRGTSSLVTQCSVDVNMPPPSIGHARRWLFNPTTDIHCCSLESLVRLGTKAASMNKSTDTAGAGNEFSP